MIFTVAFWKGLGERAIKTAAQAILAALATYAVGTTGLFDVDWKAALSAAALTTLGSILTSIGNADFTAGLPKDNPSAPDGLTTMEPEPAPAASVPVEPAAPVVADDSAATPPAPEVTA